MATLVKTAGGWKAVVRKLGFPTTAKTFRSKRDAEDWSRRIEDEMVRGVYVERAEGGRMLLGAALDRYLAEVTPTKKVSTQRTDQTNVKPLRQALGKYAIGALKADHVARYRDTRINAGLSASKVRLELALLGHLYTTAIKEWRIGTLQNPVQAIRKPNAGAGRNRRLAADEERRILAAVDSHSNPMLGWIVRIALQTGMRSGEITGLQLHQVDVDRRIVRLIDTKNESARTVPLTKSAQTLFRSAIGNPLRPKDCALMFFGEPGRDGKRRPYNFNKVWNELKSRLGLADLRFHDLRHEAVSRLVEAGLSDQEVSAVSGHKSMQMLKRYTHLRAEDLVARMDKLDAGA